ncbi:MAG TPA: hypothetical protein VFZ53_23465 [Polyangiaceae bacterium]
MKVFKRRVFRCPTCGAEVDPWCWDDDPAPICATCGTPYAALVETPVETHGIIPDSIPGGILIRHGICHEDGTPKRYDSMTEIRKAARAKGLALYGETPK